MLEKALFFEKSWKNYLSVAASAPRPQVVTPITCFKLRPLNVSYMSDSQWAP